MAALLSAYPAAPRAIREATSDTDGETFVLQAGREFKLLHTNHHGDATFASPALVDGRWYVRTASTLRAIE